MPLKLTGFETRGQVSALNRWADYIETQLTKTNNAVGFANTTANAAAAASGSTSSGGTTVHVGQATITFALSETSGPEDTSTIATVLAGWVTASSIITLTIAPGSTDHPDIEDGAIEGIILTPGNIVNGTSFQIVGYAPEGSRGNYLVNYHGV
jgi:hypothetical protein